MCVGYIQLLCPSFQVVVIVGSAVTGSGGSGSVICSGGNGLLHGVCYFVCTFCIYLGVSGCISLLL